MHFIYQAGVLFLTIFSKTTNNTTNIIRILIFVSAHLAPVFNPIICILTNTPYRNAILNRVQIHPH